MRFFSYAFLFSLAICQFGCPTTRANFDIEVFEIKEDNVSNLPIAGARVLVEEQGVEHSDEEYTDENGLASLEVVVDDTEVKTFFVTIEKNGYKKIVTFLEANPSFTTEEKYFVPRED